METQTRQKSSNLVKDLITNIQTGITNLKVKYIQKVFNEDRLGIIDLPKPFKIQAEIDCPNYKLNGICKLREHMNEGCTDPIDDTLIECPYHSAQDCKNYEFTIREEFLKDNPDNFFN